MILADTHDHVGKMVLTAPGLAVAPNKVQWSLPPLAARRLAGTNGRVYLLCMSLGALFAVVLVIAIVGVIVWGVQRLVPMPDWARILITVVAAVFLLLWLLGVVSGQWPVVVRLR